MKKLLLLCLLFLLLGNTFDGLITYWGVQVYGIEAEENDCGREVMRNRGLEAALVDKLVFAAIRILFPTLFVMLLVSVLAGWFHGYVAASFSLLLSGMTFLFSGLTWLTLTRGNWYSVCYLVSDLLPDIAFFAGLVYLILLCTRKVGKIGGLLGMLANKRD